MKGVYLSTGVDRLHKGGKKTVPVIPSGFSVFGEGVFSGLIPELQCALKEIGYSIPTPIQERSIPPLLMGRDLLGSAQTGTGKTAAFVLPILQRCSLRGKRPLPGRPEALIVAPTRELAAQIDECIGTFGKYLPIARSVTFGGVRVGEQIHDLNRGVHILTATPGRLLDLEGRKHVRLDAVETLVLDEADRMLDMGFLPDIRRILDLLPRKRQAIFLSATLPPDVTELSRSILRDPVMVAIQPDLPVLGTIRQTVRFVDRKDKPRLLIGMLTEGNPDRVLVFTKMKHGADRLARKLVDAGLQAAALHGDKTQNARTRTLDDFKLGITRVLVATDIAARGIDIDTIRRVINYDLPVDPRTYVHRIGRTARAGASGDSVSFCSAEERNLLGEIEKFIRVRLTVDSLHPYHNHNEIALCADMLAPPQHRVQRAIDVRRSRDERRLARTIPYSNGKKREKRSSA